jgi:hypothetical protein
MAESVEQRSSACLTVSWRAGDDVLGAGVVLELIADYLVRTTGILKYYDGESHYGMDPAVRLTEGMTSRDRPGQLDPEAGTVGCRS